MTITTLQNKVNETLRLGNCSVKCPVSINNRLTRTLGRAIFTRRFGGDWTSVRIEFSGQLIRQASEKSINDVLLHECAHVIANYRTGNDEGHGKIFKMVCREIGTKNDKCYTDVEWKQNPTAAKPQLTKRWEILYDTCGVVARFDRAGKAVKNVEHYRCGKCGKGGLKVRHNW